MIVFPCPSCAAKLGALEKNAGKKMPCPHCKHQVTIPSPPPARPPSSAPSNAPTLVKALRPRTQGDEDADEDEAGLPEDPLAILAPPQNKGELGWLGPYPVFEVLGQGGMGAVFRAEDRALSRPVAIKTLLPSLAANPTARKRFLREARAAAAVKHDHIVTIHNVGEHDGIPFLVMELLEGRSLEALLEEQPCLPNAEVLRIGREMAEGLAAAHERGLIHRDIKPANVWLEKQRGSNGRVKLLDFGLARPENLDTNLTATGVVFGTPSFMAPEQALGKPTDIRSDLFSLGCVLYCMATGQRPFQGDSGMEILLAVTRNDPQPPRELNVNLPPRLAALILTLMSKNKHDRPESARAVADALAAIERDRDVPLPAPAPRVPSNPEDAFRSKGTVTIGRRLKIKETPPEPPKETQPAPAGEPAPDVETKKKRKRLTKDDMRRRVVIAGILVLVLSITGFEILRRSRATPEAAPPSKKARAETPSGPPPETVIPVGTIRLPANKGAVKRKPSAYELQVARQGDASALPGLRDVFGSSRLRHWGPIHALAASPNGKLLASASADHSVKLWDAGTGREVRTFLGHLGPVLAVAFNPDGRSLASASADGTIRLWEVDGSQEGKTLTGHRGAVLGLAYDRRGSILASSGADHTIRVWEPLTGKPETLAELPEETRALACSPDGHTLATGGRGEEVVLWDLASGKERSTLPDHRGGVVALAYAADGRLAVAQGRDAIKVWNVDKERVLRHLPLDHKVHGLVFSADGKTLATSGRDGDVVLWDAVSGKKKRALPGQREGGKALALTADGQLAVGGAEGVITLWQTATGKPVPGTENTGRLTCAAFSVDGQVLAFGGTDGQVRLWERSAADEEPRILKGPEGTVRAVAFSRDGQWLAWAADEHIVVWDLAHADIKHNLTSDAGAVRTLAFSPTSGLLAAAADSKVMVWDLAAGSVSFTLSDFRGPVEALAFSSDGQLLATGDRGTFVTLWDTSEQGKKVQSLVGHLQPVEALAFARSGKGLVSGDAEGNVRVWSTDKEEASASWRRQKRPITGIAFLDDGQVVTASSDGTVRISDQTGEKEEVLVLGPSGGTIVQAAFSSDGASLATVNGNGTVYLLQRTPAPGR